MAPSPIDTSVSRTKLGVKGQVLNHPHPRSYNLSFLSVYITGDRMVNVHTRFRPCIVQHTNTTTNVLQAAQHSQGIQTLLEAEKEAAKIVQQARQCNYPPIPHLQCHVTQVPIDRVRKLRDAHTDAAKEIEAYKKAKEQEFQAFESSVRHRDISLFPHLPTA